MTVNNRKILIWQWGRFGAGPRLAYEMACGMDKHTDVVPILSLSDNAEIEPAAIEMDFPYFGVETYEHVFGFLLKTLRLNQLLGKMEKLVDREKPVAAINVMPGYWDYFATRKLQKLGVPVVTLVHDMASHPGDRFQLAIALQKRQLEQSTGIITLSDFVAKKLESQKFLEGRCHQTIPHPAFGFPELSIPLPPRSDYDGARKLRVMLAGRLKAYKGLEIFVEALQRLDSREVEARIVGKVSNSPSIERAKSLPNCELALHWHSEVELVRQIDWADIVVLPYVEATQSGIIPLAYSRHKPVVVTPVGGLPEQVRHNSTGLISKNVSAEAIAEAVSHFVEEPGFYAKCARNAGKFAENELGWKSIASLYVKFALSLPGV